MQLHQATSETWGAEPVSFSVDFAVTHTAEQIESVCTPAQHGYSVPGDSQGCLWLHSNGEIAARGCLQYGMSLPQTVQGSLHMEKGTVTDLRKLFHN